MSRRRPPTYSDRQEPFYAPAPVSQPQTDPLLDRPDRNIPVLKEFSGILNIMQHLRVRAQQRGFRSLTQSIDAYGEAIRAKTRALSALEGLERQEERLRGPNLDRLRIAEARNIDAEVETSEARFIEAQARTHKAVLDIRKMELQAQLDEEQLRHEIERQRRLNGRRLDLEDERLERSFEQVRAERENSSARQSAADQKQEDVLLAEFERLAKLVAEEEKRITAGREDGTLSEVDEQIALQRLQLYRVRMERLMEQLAQE